MSIPSAKQYASAIRALGNISDRQVQMLRLHYHAPARTVAVGVAQYIVVNGDYGRLASQVGKLLDYQPDGIWLGVLVEFDKRKGRWHWIMHPEVAKALEMIGWVESSGILLPEEVVTSEGLFEGATTRVLVNAYERNAEARAQCIQHYGASCCICGFDFGRQYGEVGDGYIEVRHLRQLSDIGKEYEVDPVNDLRPVCANCHAILHQRKPAYSIEEVKAFRQNMSK